MAISPLEARLRAAFAGTAETPRPIADVDLPEQYAFWRTPEFRATLRPAAVLMPILLQTDETASVILTQRSDALRNHAGQISLPGGLRDPGDPSAAHAALREAHEEVGLPPEEVEVIGFLGDHPTITGFRVTPVVGVVRRPFKAAFDVSEVAAVFEVPLAWVLDPLNYQRKTLTRDGAEVHFFEILHGSYRIWGATAAILRDFADHIRLHDHAV